MNQMNRILAVDDSATNLLVMEDTLEDDYDLRTADSGEMALEIGEEFLPEVVLLDIMMPGIDGYETCRRLRANAALRHTKIIMVSAKAMVNERLAGYEAGVDDYVTKPFDKDELLAKVRVYLRLKKTEEVDELKSTALSLLVHETRTPLNGILSPAEMLMSEDAMDKDERIMLSEMIHRNAKRMLAFLDKSNQLSELKAGNFPFQFGTVNLRDTVADAVEHVQSKADEKGVSVSCDLPDSAMATMDSAQIVKVVTSLLDNAIRFSPPQGKVAITACVEDGYFNLAVKDDGEGIDPGFLRHVFDALTDSDFAHHSEGQGLSLAIAREIVRQHGGDMGVESRKGSGATFSVRLPLARPAAESQAPVAVHQMS